MRNAIEDLGGDTQRINPLCPTELVIDHSVIADVFGRSDAFRINSELEFERNSERYQLLRWAQQAFADFSVVPPDTGICHQVNLNTLRGSSSPAMVRTELKSPWLTRTRWSAPIRIPRWSTG
jgi:aconitate hydratase